ncbi:MAG: hypothetical protein J5604_04545 [Bacteroidales bacterium]|nr:hypothetical protein [Bacteroidales bacterium]
MKKCVFILAVVALALIACTKSDAPVKDEGIKLNIKVASPSGESKAMKKDWVSGDKINIWFSDITIYDHAAPDLVITYNGTDWVPGDLRKVSGSPITPSASGIMIVVYEGHNGLGSYNWTPNGIRSEYDYGKYIGPYEVTYCTPLMLYNDGIGYTYSGGVLTSNISSWKFRTTFKVLIKGIDKAEAADYQLHVWKNAGDKSSDFPFAIKGFSVDDLGTSVLTANSTGWTGGVYDEEGVAFYFSSFTCTTSDVVHFEIFKKGWADYRWCDITGHTFASTPDKCLGIWFDYSKFK